MKFKVGDKVKVININSGCKNGFNIGDVCKITRINNDEEFPISINNGCCNGFAYENELELISFKVGDKVKVDKNSTIAQIIDNFWGGCQVDTLNFLKEYFRNWQNDKTLEICNCFGENLVFKGYESYSVRPELFYLVEKAKEVKEMTIKEISEALGYEVKVVKEN